LVTRKSKKKFLFREPVSKLGRETPSRIRAWRLIWNKEKQIVLFEKTAIRLRSLYKDIPVIPVDRVGDKKGIIEKMEGPT
jgi:hypothetical protein